jgi:glycine cleavage system transcriptional repressor
MLLAAPCARKQDFAAQRPGVGAKLSAIPPATDNRFDTMSTPASNAMKQLIVINAIGSDRTGLVYDLTRAVADCGGNILESRMSALGTEFAMLLLVAGNWHTPAKLEAELKKLTDASGITATLRKTEARAPRPDVVTYTVDVVCLDQPGIVYNLAGFFSSRGIDIAELSTRSYAAAHTGAPMFAVQMVIHIPNRIHIAALREEFLDLCDQMNLDAILEPMKS